MSRAAQLSAASQQIRHLGQDILLMNGKPLIQIAGDSAPIQTLRADVTIAPAGSPTTGSATRIERDRSRKPVPKRAHPPKRFGSPRRRNQGSATRTVPTTWSGLLQGDEAFPVKNKDQPCLPLSPCNNFRTGAEVLSVVGPLLPGG